MICPVCDVEMNVTIFYKSSKAGNDYCSNACWIEDQIKKAWEKYWEIMSRDIPDEAPSDFNEWESTKKQYLTYKQCYECDISMKDSKDYVEVYEEKHWKFPKIICNDCFGPDGEYYYDDPERDAAIERGDFAGLGGLRKETA